MSSSPDKQAPSQNEKMLASISDAQSREAKYINDKVGQDYVDEARRDRSSEVLGRISADWAKEAPGDNRKLNDFGNALALVDSEAARANALVEGNTKAKEARGKNVNAALRTGKGLESTAQSSVARLAQISNEKGRQALQRKTARRAATLNALGTVAGAAGTAYSEGLGVFAKGEKPGTTITGDTIEDGIETSSTWESQNPFGSMMS